MEPSCETKPISPLRISDCGLRIGYRAAAGPPGLRPTGRDLRRAKRAKRSQLRQTNQFGPADRLGPWEGETCETNPIHRPGRGQRGAGRGANVQNKPNSRRRRVGQGSRDAGRGFFPHPSTLRPRPCQADRAKQTQFPAGPGGTGPQGRGARVQSAKQSQFGRSRARTPNLRRDDDAKQSQFRRANRTGKYFAEKDLWRIEHATDLGKTKPICPGSTATAPGRGRNCCRGRAHACETKPIFGPGRRDGSGIRPRMPPAPGLPDPTPFVW